MEKVPATSRCSSFGDFSLTNNAPNRKKTASRTERRKASERRQNATAAISFSSRDSGGRRGMVKERRRRKRKERGAKLSRERMRSREWKLECSEVTQLSEALQLESSSELTASRKRKTKYSMASGVAPETELDRAVRRLRENDYFFTELDLRGDWSGEGIGDQGVSVLADALRFNTSLKWLNLTSNSIGDEGVSVLANVLRINTSLKGLELGYNKIGDGGVSVLSDVLRFNTSLKWLDLASNSIGDGGVSMLANALRINTSLTNLGLYNNSIGNKGVRVLADGLRVSTSLTELSLGYNFIGDEGVRVLADVLRVNTSLKRLDLWNNSIGDGGKVLEKRVAKLTEINEQGASPHVALGQKVELILDSEHDTIKDAVSLALTGLERFSESDERREILHSLLGSPKHGKDVAASIDLAMWKNLYGHAATCNAGPALVNLLRAQPSLSEHRDEEEQGGLYPFMLLATMQTAEVGDVFEVLLMKPDLVASAITML